VPRLRIRSASWLLLAQVATKVLSLPVGIILARSLGPAGKGSLSILQLVAGTSIVIFDFGLSASLTYYAARGEAHGRDAIRLVLSIALAVVSCLALLYLLFGQWFALSVLHTDQQVLVLVAVLAVGPGLVGSLTQSFVIGSGSVRRASMVTMGTLLFQLVAYAAVWALHLLTLPIAVGIWFGATVIEASVLLALASRVKAVAVAPGLGALIARSWRLGMVMWIAGTVGFAANRVDMYLLAFFKGTGPVGIYSIAVTFAELVFFIPTALNGVMFPKTAAERETVLPLTLRVCRTVWPLVALCAAGVFGAAVLLVPFMYGAMFAGAIPALAVLLVGTVPLSLTGAMATYLAGTGHARDWTIAAAGNLTVNVLLNLTLIPRFSILGAAASSAVSYLVAVVITTAFFVNRTHARLSDLLVPRPAEFMEFGQALRRALGGASD